MASTAAEIIFIRVKKLAGGRVIPARIAKTSEADMSEAGVSGAKYRTLQSLAHSALSRENAFNSLHTIDSDEEILNQLTSLWGIGPWPSVSGLPEI